MALELGQSRMFGGTSTRYRHQSGVLGCPMTFTVYLPPAAEAGKVPVVYFLSGLTCNDENFTTKAGAQRKAAELGVALVAPDTSPRGLDVPGEADSWDFGVGAGGCGCRAGRRLPGPAPPLALAAAVPTRANVPQRRQQRPPAASPAAPPRQAPQPPPLHPPPMPHASRRLLPQRHGGQVAGLAHVRLRGL
jgi:hypothetical protein